MARFQHKFLVVSLFLVFSINLFGNNLFEGIWRTSIHKNLEMDTYICIERMGKDEYFVVHIDPANNHQFDYATYGYIDDHGYLVVDLGETIYYIESYDEMSLYHNWNFREDMNAYLFTKIVASTIVEEDENVISPEDFQLFIQEEMRRKEENIE